MALAQEITQTQRPNEMAASATLAALLALTSDAVVCFDATGTILLANEEALRLIAPIGLDRPCEDLVGLDVRLLFMPMADMTVAGPFALDLLPFPLDGGSARVQRIGTQGHASSLVVRCERLSSPQEAYLLIAHQDADGSTATREHERLVDELSRANRRLSGTLDIVLGTLDSPSVGTLFERVLERLRETMDAYGTTVYLSERDGFHLRGVSSSLEGVHVPRFLSAKASLTQAIMESERSISMRVLAPEGDELRRGRLSHRRVQDDQTHVAYRAPASQLPPFVSFLAVPVRFGGRVIALIEVGWRSARTIARDDAHLLDAVTRYLAVQLVGAFSALRAQRREELALRASELRDALVAEPLPNTVRARLLEAVARDLDCLCAQVERSSAIDGHEVVHLPLSHEEVAVSQDMLSFQGPIQAIRPDASLGAWLREQGEPCLGALVDTGGSPEERVCFLALRSADAEPFDDLEMGYLRQVVDTVRAVFVGDAGRRRDHRISQALQTGMRSQLQQVEGISSQGVYSSATEAAFVGGDFYDLIRLPERRACVIMGDVSGKGVEAASVSAAVRTALGAYSWEGLAPSHMVRLLNDFLLGFARVETFATLFVGIVDLGQATLTYCSAGHPPALMLRSSAGELEWLGEQSGVVGAFRDMAYHDGTVRLGTGDILLLYTDGTTEARAADGRFFGEDGLRDMVMREGPRGFEGLLERLLASVERFTGNSLDDDVAMVALRFDEVG